jgi:thioredoxin-like negative regulator of GroEL
MAEIDSTIPRETGHDRQKPVVLSDYSEYEQLRTSSDLLLLEFVTAGCGICASMEPILGTVARSAPGTVAIANGATVPDLAVEFDVRSVPTFVVLKDGEEVTRLNDGFQRAETLVTLLEEHSLQ